MKYRVIVAGSRDFNDYELLKERLDFLFSKLDKNEIEIICGLAKGADTLGEKYAKERNLKIKYFPADWEKYGKSAGYIRNSEMGKYATHLVAFWNGNSRGTKNMIDIAETRKLIKSIQKY